VTVAEKSIPAQAEIDAMPKLEMHVHLEGSIPPQLVEQMAREQGESLPRPAEQLYVTDDLGAFLETLDWVCSLVRYPEQARQLAINFGEYCASQNIIYAEVIVNPTHWKGLDFRSLLAAIAEGFDTVAERGLCDLRLLPSILRQQSTEEAMELVRWMGSAMAVGLVNRIVGLSIDGNEAAAGRTVDRFAEAYQLARDLGFGCTTHAGESSGADGVVDALDVLGAQRLDHGVRAIDDPALVQRLVHDNITLNVCLSSNCALMYDSIEQHPIRELHQAGVPVTINTDDPVVLNTSLNQELGMASRALQWNLNELLQLQKNAVHAAFCDQQRKQELFNILDAYAVH